MKVSDAPIYVIGNRRDTARHAGCLAQLDGLGLSATWIEALDGHDPAFAFHRHRQLAGPFWGRTHAFKPGAFACYLSHAVCWRAIAAGAAPWALVFEDDVRVLAGPFFAAPIPPVGGEADVIFINRRTSDLLRGEGGEHGPRYRFARDAFLERLAGGAARSWIPFPGTDGYLVSPKGAARLIANMERHRIVMEVDYAMLFATLGASDVEALAARPPSELNWMIQYFVNISRDAAGPGLEAWVARDPLVEEDGRYASTILHERTLSYEVFDPPGRRGWRGLP